MRYKKTLILGLIVLFWMSMIYLFSAQSADDSSEMSSPVAETLTQILYPRFDTFSESKQNELLNFWSHIIRKCAHFAEYGLLGSIVLLWLGAMVSERNDGDWVKALSQLKNLLIPFIIGALYAVSDEIHQRFVPGRSGQISDVLLDSAGAATGILIVFVISKIIRAHRRNR